MFGNTLTADHMYSRRYMNQICATCSNAIISKTLNIFWSFNWIFAICTRFCEFSKKDHLYSLNTSELIVSKECGYLNALKLLFQNTLREWTCSRVLNTAEMTMGLLLSYISINPRHRKSENISLRQIWNRRTVG